MLRATTAYTFSTSQLPKVFRTPGVFNILTSKCASRHNGVQFFISHLASWLRTRRFSEPTFRPSGATNHWKNTVNRDFPTFSRICIFFLLTLCLLLFSLLIFLFSLPKFRSQNVKNTRGSDHFWRFTQLHYTTLHDTLHYTPLHYTTLHYTTLHYTTLNDTTLHYLPLHYITLHYTTLHYTTLHYITLQLQLHNYTPLHSTTLHYIKLHYTTLHYTALHYSTLHYTTFHYTSLHYTTLHSTTLQLQLQNYTQLHYNYNYNYTPLHSTTLHSTTLNYTSSTAQGVGGSFKNRKPIGEIGCCESGMAERSH